jgi:hypothetical protein
MSAIGTKRTCRFDCLSPFGGVLANVKHLIDVGGAAPHLRQRVSKRSPQVSNRFVSENRLRLRAD